MDWTVALGGGAIGAETYTLAVLGRMTLSRHSRRPRLHATVVARSRDKLYTALIDAAPMVAVRDRHGTVGTTHRPRRSIRARELAGRHRDQVVVIEGDSDDLGWRRPRVGRYRPRAVDLGVQVAPP